MSERTVYTAYTQTKAQRIEQGKREALARMKRRLADADDDTHRERVREHFARLSPNLFEDGVPGDFAEVVLDRVHPRDAWHRIVDNRCVLCGRHLTTEQAVRYSVGPECFERVFHGLGEVAS